MTVTVEIILFENPRLFEERLRGEFYPAMEEILVPEGVGTGGVPQDIYDGYRRGLDGACADIVVSTLLPDGTSAVLASKRSASKHFGGKWWMYGGAVHAYRSIGAFLRERVQRECGIAIPRIESLIGIYRTCAEDIIGSTLQPCFVTTVPYANVERVVSDGDHTAMRLFTAEELGHLPEDERHWYPMRVFSIALATMPAGR